MELLLSNTSLLSGWDSPENIRIIPPMSVPLCLLLVPTFTSKIVPCFLRSLFVISLPLFVVTIEQQNYLCRCPNLLYQLLLSFPTTLSS